MTIVTRIGLDLAKDVFQVHAVDAQDEKVTNKQLQRKDLLQWFAKLERSDDCLVAMEACGSCHHWRRELEKLGYSTMAIPPAYVKPYVRTNKNEANDARAICEAASRPGMPTVRLKTVAEQDAMTLIAQLGDMKQFAHARSASEYLGVVPRQFSSGGKTMLGGISKRGNSQLRSLLIHGARSVLRVARNKDDKLSRWAVSVVERRGNNVAAVAVANKLLRIVWAMQTKEQDYRVMTA